MSNQQPLERVGTLVHEHNKPSVMIFLDKDLKSGNALVLSANTLRGILERGGRTDISKLPPRK